MLIRRRVLISALEGWGTTQHKAEEGCSSYCEKCTTVGLRITGRWAARIFNVFSEGPKSFWDQFDECDSQDLRRVEQNIRESKYKIQVKTSHLRVPTT